MGTHIFDSQGHIIDPATSDSIYTLQTTLLDLDATLEELKTAIESTSGFSEGLTYSTVAVSQAIAGYHSLMLGAVGKTVRLHGAILTSSGAGTIIFQSSTDIAAPDAGAGLVALSGTMTIGANGGFVLPFNPDPRACLQATSLSIGFTSAGTLVNGWAVVSTN